MEPIQSIIPIEISIRGGESDCRNRLIHQMFLMIGLGERAGSGLPKIYKGWESQHWRPPALYEKIEPEQTLLELRMLDLLPQTVIEELRARFGETLDRRSNLDRLILATAAIEQVVTHTRMTEMTADHPHDLSLALHTLVKDGLLESSGRGRGTIYHLKEASWPKPEQVFGGRTDTGPVRRADTESLPSSPHKGDSLTHKGDSLAYKDGSLAHSEASLEHKPTTEIETISERPAQRRREDGALNVEGLTFPLIDDLNELNGELFQILVARTAAVGGRQRAQAQDMREAILEMCSGYYLSLQVLSKLLNRKTKSLRATWGRTKPTY